MVETRLPSAILLLPPSIMKIVGTNKGSKVTSSAMHLHERIVPEEQFNNVNY